MLWKQSSENVTRKCTQLFKQKTDSLQQATCFLQLKEENPLNQHYLIKNTDTAVMRYETPFLFFYFFLFSQCFWPGRFV